MRPMRVVTRASCTAEEYTRYQSDLAEERRSAVEAADGMLAAVAAAWERRTAGPATNL